MDRRNFLKVVAAAGIVAAVPAIARLPGDWPVNSIVHRKHISDYGQRITLGAETMVNGKIIGFAFLLSNKHWKAMTPEQQSETWALIDRRLLSEIE